MKPFLGILLKVLSALAFTVMAASLKLVSTGYPTGELVFFRSFFALIPLLAWLTWQGDLVDAVRTNDMRGHLTRGAFGSAGMFCGFVALTYLPLHDAIARVRRAVTQHLDHRRVPHAPLEMQNPR